jgi:hypothetical protein
MTLHSRTCVPTLEVGTRVSRGLLESKGEWIEAYRPCPPKHFLWSLSALRSVPPKPVWSAWLSRPTLGLWQSLLPGSSPHQA